MDFVRTIAGYTQGLAAKVEAADCAAVSAAVDELYNAYRRGARIFTMGNGGSAATAEHLAADFEKNAFIGKAKPKIMSLAGQAAKILAYGNDLSFDSVFAEQLRALGSAGDVAVMISASGNSPNIVCALDAAREVGMTVIGLSGFSGGALMERADISVHFSCDSYEMAEDLHSVTCHLFVLCCKAIA